MRSIWKGSISFGLVNVPVKVYSATEDHDLKFHQVHAKDNGRIRYKRVCEECGEVVDYSDISRAFEADDGRSVVITDAQVRPILGKLLASAPALRVIETHAGLLKGVTERAEPGGVVVLPADEPLLDPHVPATVRALRFGSEPGTAVQIVGVEQDERTHLSLRLHHRAGGEEVRVGLSVFGGHNARNAAAALAVGLELGCPVAAMLEALAQVRPVGDRGRVLGFGPHLLIADCYNANPGSMAAARASTHLPPAASALSHSHLAALASPAPIVRAHGARAAVHAAAAHATDQLAI